VTGIETVHFAGYRVTAAASRFKRIAEAVKATSWRIGPPHLRRSHVFGAPDVYTEKEDIMRIRHTMIDSPLGIVTLATADEHLTGLYFRHHRPRPPALALGDYVPAEEDELLRTAARELNDYLHGRRRCFDVPHWLLGEPRQHRVWELLSDIDYGYTTTYGALAAELADGITAYEVGQIVGRNPLSIVVPCHRVIGKNGKLTGYAGGLDRKRFLLELEEPAAAVAGRLF